MYEIIPMTKNHVQGIKEIDDLSFESPWSLKSFESEFENPLAVYFVAISNNKVIGYCGYWWIFDEAQITNVAVHPDFRGNGIGKELVKTMIDKCSRTDIYSITLEVRVSNTVAQNLYKSLGFKDVGLRPNYYNNTEDAILMTKEIEQVD